jgi:hypothetical protein
MEEYVDEMSLFSLHRTIDIPDALWMWTMKEHPILLGLPKDEEKRLRELTGQFLAAKQFYPVEGVRVDESLKISIAAQACLPVLKLDLKWYRGWSTLVLTDEEFDVPMSQVDSAGVVHEFDETASGEFLHLGSIILSIADIEASGWGEGYNVVIHEMAHVLDRKNGAMDGAPLLHRDMDRQRWAGVFSAAFTDIQTRNRGPIDEYAAEAPEEFFAVSTELFFEQPWVLAGEYPDVYEQMHLFYRQDPLQRRPGPQPRRRRRHPRAGN